ncbi:MAG: AAA family ATPase [Alphaproteobacteria bacterium]|nr:AAA family ATPase [Alphaproteobacteria bacterium]
MIHFSRLRLYGFKSFVDRTELEIGPGLNGIVGPNGCGKSNLVEALRWIMGESSAKRMRGGGMEDVIFSGTDKRTARNIAEVSVLLDNTNRKAPAAYNGLDEIEIIRRIERDHGSNYKINGKNARARDVQMLFADTLTGANSPALVSQGAITRIINAKPADRRLVLEESAGVSGLYARRHEAELRLRAADTNLLRLDDIMGSMESRLSSLKRQSRQATKYKNLNAQIRQFEVMIAWLEWNALQTRQEELHKSFVEVESKVAEQLAIVARLTKIQTSQAEDLPALRKKETEIAASLQTRKILLQRMEDDEKRHKEQLEESQALLEQAKQDVTHETQQFEENSRTLERIQSEEKDITDSCSNEQSVSERKMKERDALHVRLNEWEERFTILKETMAESRARREAIENRIKTADERLFMLQNRRSKIETDISGLNLGEENTAEIKKLEEKILNLEATLKNLNSQVEGKQAAIASSTDKTEAARKEMTINQSELDRLKAELATLSKIFESDRGLEFKAVLDDITTESGFEQALSRALGESLNASLDNSAPAFWSNAANSDTPELPEGLPPLFPHINAPLPLHAALSQIGCVEEESEGEALSVKLKTGQSIVSAKGDYWRWDGLRIKASATDRHSQLITQKNRLSELQAIRHEHEQKAEKSRRFLEQAIESEKASRQDLEQTSQKIRALEQELNKARPALIHIREKISGIEKEKSRLAETLKTVMEDIQSQEKALQDDRHQLLAIEKSQSPEQEKELEKEQNTLNALRENYREAVRDYDLFEQQSNTRRARLQAIADERISLQNRTIRSRERLKSLKQRIESLKDKHAELEQQPAAVDTDRSELLQIITDMENQRNMAAEELAARESAIFETSKELKSSELTLGLAREDRARIEATLTAINEQLESMNNSIEQRFRMKPSALPEHTAEDLVNYRHGDLENLKKRQEKLTGERDSIGPVNLQADKEAEDLEKEVSELMRERNELMQAIEELRGAISRINKEARTRLMQAFESVNTHFQSLFTRLFEGGKAHLALIDSPDPLEAGLEIFAQPPGKTLQSLSLLSGGEQTLTSIALIFAMFLTNPSPICVLDEIDAPLDDANVDRVCNLLEEIAERGETRFLIITHHRLTMARMDRLYGVTMTEKGVSQLVSVDLHRSFDFSDQKVA